jgi:hypothetical protein
LLLASLPFRSESESTNTKLVCARAPTTSNKQTHTRKKKSWKQIFHLFFSSIVPYIYILLYSTFFYSVLAHTYLYGYVVCIISSSNNSLIMRHIIKSLLFFSSFKFKHTFFAYVSGCWFMLPNAAFSIHMHTFFSMRESIERMRLHAVKV